jgi:hypothetical protein
MRIAIALILVVSTCCKSDNPVNRGDELFAVLDEVVRRVSIERDTEKVLASRGSSEAPFRYRFVRDGVATDCPSTAALDSALRQTFSIRAVEVYEGEQLKRLATLPAMERTELRIESAGQPPEPFVAVLHVETWS